MSLATDKNKLQNQLDGLITKIDHNKKFNTLAYDRADLLCYFATSKLNLSYWKYLYILTLRQWGFNYKAAESLFEWGQWGHNWDRLHPTENDLSQSSEDVKKKFYGEVEYCSDRMGTDRLFRCHWLFHLYFEVLNKEKG